MKRRNLVVSLILASVAFVLLGTQLAHAMNFRSGDNITVDQKQKIDQTIYVAGRNLNINSEVDGDVFCAGQTVNISGTVHGDVICAGQTVNISGKVDGDVRLAGQTVTLSAQVTGNASIASQTFTMDSASKIGGDASIGSTTATINGQVGRDLSVAGQTATINSTVGRDLQARIDLLQLTSNARVKGNVDYTSSNKLDAQSGSLVSGNVHQNLPDNNSSKHGALFNVTLGWFLFFFLSMSIVSLVLVLLFPEAFHVTTNRAHPRPWKALFLGLAASILVPVLAVVLLVSLVGAPLGILVGLAWLMILMLSGPVSGYYLGRWLLQDSRRPVVTMLVGGTVLILLYFIPVIGFIALFGALWIGAGLILMEVFARTPKPVYVKAETKPKKKTK